MNYWLAKSEPNEYSWNDLLKDGSSVWDGVRNYQARNNLRQMKKGDYLLFYHSNIGQEIVGIAKVVKEFFQDPTTKDRRWLSVKISPVQSLKHPVTLRKIKANPKLLNMALVKQSRLSVMPVTKEEFNWIISLSYQDEKSLP